MLKTVAATVVLSLGIASAASAASNDALNEWNGFAKETAIPVVTYSHNIDWVNLYANPVSYPLNEWNGFAQETPTPVVAYSQEIDWANLYL